MKTTVYEEEARDFFTLEYPPLFRYAFYFTGDKELAEDLCQETFIRWFQMDGQQDIETPRAWLKKVLSRLVVSNYRRQKTRAGLEIGLGERPVAYLDQGFESLEVEDLLSRLPWRDQLLIKMKFSGSTYQEMAEITGIAVGSVGTLLARAIKKLRNDFPGGEVGQNHELSGSGKIITVRGQNAVIFGNE
ncbi:MAG TPA: sigma-70 family RNA polymerase sigma factor [Syntrophomonadaceae bacterium]|nr:sigma-70 family RNA polymerase sigma factor [Syntrophomonadaceae bacterium]